MLTHYYFEVTVKRKKKYYTYIVSKKMTVTIGFKEKDEAYK